MKNKLLFFTYAVVNTTLFLPYFLYLLIGNHYPTFLNGWFPLIVFYVCNLTGTFLVRSFGKKVSTRELLLFFLLLASVGSFLGILVSINALWLDLSAILLGLSCSLLLPLYLTIQYHERRLFHRSFSGKDYGFAFLTILLFMPLIILLVKVNLPELAFGLYGIAFLVSFFLLRNLPHYDHGKMPNTSFDSRFFLLFLVLAGMTFAVKSLRVLADNHFSLILMTLLAILLIGVFYLIQHSSFKFSLPRYVYLFSFLQGMLTNFFILFGTFYLFSLQKGVYLYSFIYLAYGLGIISSLFIGSKVLNLFPKVEKVTLCGISLLVGTGLIFIPVCIPVGGFLIGFFSNLNSSLLNKVAYTKTTGLKDSSLLVKNRWGKLGSIFQQSLLFLLFISFCHFFEIPILSLLETITGKSLASHLTSIVFVLRITGGVILFGISVCYLITLYFYEKELKTKQAPIN
ncbi:hypothetical protein CKN82_05200 [Carnobacterium divergens]|uniref:hypothetical protein n=1 Tax=Carnobacterium divergens TaxID=2748 RepID=UPI0010726268|nr:hypothetical protein [Carnobacterium divergens]MDT1997129.1 hypothetical protein [Carnobacterium divergens]TFI66187.1 hypothetical protein CKN76_05650 [Carnobacterium divergens]TFI66220.1 hypothetical protein CKN59_05635 [Carnobacterium divergens]TFI69849.1 hypothetical protein CKN70_05250 [Carnobacterium divergens]TFI81219.1 hypothetical protein CKN74_05615 [Carnobacterium divergens]